MGEGYEPIAGALQNLEEIKDREKIAGSDELLRLTDEAIAAIKEHKCIPPLNEEVMWILGRPNFTLAGIARVLRKGGFEIKGHAEEEQATVIHWYLGLYFKHGDNWREEADKLLKAWNSE